MPANWKRVERRAARVFGASRRPLSGGNQSGSEDGPRDDAQHKRIFIEAKHGKRVAPWTLYLDAKAKAKAEGTGRTPVLMLHQANQQGVLVCFNSNDFEAVAREWALANGFVLSPKEVHNGSTSAPVVSKVRKRKKKGKAPRG